ncbi:MAG: DUF1579 domain-containing protein [Planctomycetes bacterium]|nr:DUF1579 domain-containing protein [Planctomycetota bacterium]
MKRLGMLFAVVAVCGFALMVPSVFAQDHKEGDGHKHGSAPTPEQMQEHMEMMKMGMPGPQHAKLKEMVGTWNTETKLWMGPEGEPTVAKGVSVFTMILGDRYLQEDFTSDFMGMEFKGRGMTGFDNAKQKCVSTWCDNMGTHMMMFEGTYDEATKTTTLKGETQMTPTKKAQMRIVEKRIDKDTCLMQMYITEAGAKEFKNMEIKYTRDKKVATAE